MLDIDISVIPKDSSHSITDLKIGAKIPTSFKVYSGGGYALGGNFVNGNKIPDGTQRFVLFLTYKDPKTSFSQRACLTFIEKPKVWISPKNNVLGCLIKKGEINFIFAQHYNVVIRVDLPNYYRAYLTLDYHDPSLFNNVYYINLSRMEDIIDELEKYNFKGFKNTVIFPTFRRLYKNAFYSSAILLFVFAELLIDESKNTNQSFSTGNNLPITVENETLKPNNSMNIDAYDHANFFESPSGESLPILPPRFWYSNDVSSIIFISEKRSHKNDHKTPMHFLSIIGEHLNEISDKEEWVNFLESQASKLMGMSYLYSTIAELLRNQIEPDNGIDKK